MFRDTQTFATSAEVAAGLMTAAAPADAGQRIRAWRLSRGLTQEDLARALSVTFASVSRWENGHVVPSKLAWRALRELAGEIGGGLEGASAHGM